MESTGEITQNIRISRVENLTKKITTLADLIYEFKEVSSPKYNNVGINADLLLKNASDVNNLPKHNANVPDPLAYKEVLNETRKILINYLDPYAQLDFVEDTIFGEGKSWYEITDETSDFSEAFSYILVVNRLQNINYQGLLSLKWDMIIDFDPSSDIDGFAEKYQQITQVSPWKRVLNKIDSKKKFTYSNKAYWIFANGIVDEPETVVEIEKWKNKSGRFLSDLLEKFHEEYTKPVKVFMVPVGNEKATEKLTDAFTEVYDEDVDFALLSVDSDYNNIDLENFKKYGLTIEEFCENLQIAFAGENLAHGIIKAEFPAEEGKKYEITESFMIELRDSFDVAYLDCALPDEKDSTKSSRINFYCGDTEISWYGLRENFDIVRPEKNNIIKEINKDLEDRGRLLRKVYYEPGMGGTTLMRRIGWEMRENFPTLILKKYNEQTAKNIQKIYDNTHLSILILADNNAVDNEKIKNMQSELRRMGFAFVIVYFERKLKGQKSSGAIYTVINGLSKQKAREMKTRLEPFVEDTNIVRKLEEIVNNLKDGEILLLENTRHMDYPNKLESSCDEELSKYWSSLGEVFILDAFGSAHRAHASTYGIAKYLPHAIGFLIEKELVELNNIKEKNKTIILGGAKVSDKIGVIKNLIKTTDKILLGGAMCATFLKSIGYEVGKTYVEEEKLEEAEKLINTGIFILPIDVVTENGIKKIEEINKEESILDIGPITISLFKSQLHTDELILINGTMGLWEEEKYSKGTEEIFNHLTDIKAKVIVCGGDTGSASKYYNFNPYYLSTGGGATLEYLEGKELLPLKIMEN